MTGRTNNTNEWAQKMWSIQYALMLVGFTAEQAFELLKLELQAMHEDARRFGL